MLKLCKPFMKSALAAKIRTFRNATALASAMDAEAVPSQLGGTLRYNHEEWLNSFVVCFYPEQGSNFLFRRQPNALPDNP